MKMTRNERLWFEEVGSTRPVHQQSVCQLLWGTLHVRATPTGSHLGLSLPLGTGRRNAISSIYKGPGVSAVRGR